MKWSKIEAGKYVSEDKRFHAVKAIPQRTWWLTDNVRHTTCMCTNLAECKRVANAILNNYSEVIGPILSMIREQWERESIEYSKQLKSIQEANPAHAYVIGPKLLESEFKRGRVAVLSQVGILLEEALKEGVK